MWAAPESDVVCVDDLVNVKDSLMCFENSSSRDKEKIVFATDDDGDKVRRRAMPICLFSNASFFQ